MKILFLSHCPHAVHYNFAEEINAQVRILPFYKYTQAIKKCKPLVYLYPFISLLYCFFIPINEDVLLVDGGSSLYTAFFLKMRNKKLKLIYLDGDLFFFYLNKQGNMVKKWIVLFFKKVFLKSIDGVISVSKENKKYASKFLNVPMEICIPYPQKIEKNKFFKKNYGLYIGRLDPDKNIKRIIDFGLQCPYFEKFIIVGNGVLNKYVKMKANHHKKLIYVGEQDDVGAFYNKCKFLIHFPDYDPHPCTVMEAALYGCFPIISEGVGSKYLFNRFFVIKDVNDFNRTNEKIKYILEHEQEAKNLLSESIHKIPDKEKSLKFFKNKFQKLINQDIK